MKIIEIAALENGAHRNMQSSSIVAPPYDWAVIPDTLDTPNFPFGTVEVEEIDGVMTVTSWTAGELPSPEPVSEPEPSLEERNRADIDYIAIMTGVKL